MNKKQEALKILTAKGLIDPINYLVDDYQSKTDLAPEEYYYIRYELAKKNNNHKQAEEAWDLYKVFHRE